MRVCVLGKNICNTEASYTSERAEQRMGVGAKEANVVSEPD